MRLSGSIEGFQVEKENFSFTKKKDFTSYLVLYDSFFFCEELSVYLTAFQACLHGML